MGILIILISAGFISNKEENKTFFLPEEKEYGRIKIAGSR
jgi:hypothetical protein